MSIIKTAEAAETARGTDYCAPATEKKANEEYLAESSDIQTVYTWIRRENAHVRDEGALAWLTWRVSLLREFLFLVKA
jgi:hypothetical protein